MPYSAVDDLLVGQIPLPKGMIPQTFVDDAADEIDSHIGFLYRTPVDVKSDNTPVVRPVRLLLKRLNNMLASGRMIMAVSMNSARNELHPYGASLVRDATKVLEQIASGEVSLDGAELVTPSDADTNFTGPAIANLDAESNVESFYNRIANPGYFYGPDRFWPGNSATGMVAS